METLEKIAILLKVRKLQSETGQFSEAWDKRKKAIVADPNAQKQWTDFPEYPETSNPDIKKFCALANAQLSQYRGKKGIFSHEWIMDSAKDMPAYLWWDQNGASTPELQAVARMVLAQPASASICERINSEFAFVKDRRKNKLAHEKANKLVRLFHNLRLLKRMNKLNYTEPAIGWVEDNERSGVCKFKPSSENAKSALLCE